MIQTLFVYIGLTLTLLFLANKYFRTKRNRYLVLMSFVFAIIMGLRYGVGADYFAYKYNYDYICLNGVDVLEKWELGFLYLARICASLGFSSIGFFFIVALIQMLLTLFVVRKYKQVIPFLVLSFMLQCIWLNYANGLRQIIAINIFYWAILAAAREKVLSYYVFVLFAALFHNSALGLLLLYPFLMYKKEWFKNIRNQCILLVSSLCIMFFSYAQNFIGQFEQVLDFAGYGHYIGTDSEVFSEGNLSLGIGFWVTFAMNYMIILYSNKVKSYFQNSFVSLIYDLAFIGIIFKYVFFQSHLIIRFLGYFMNFRFIFIGFLLAYLYYNSKKAFYVFFFLLLLTFVAYMSKMDENTVRYIFYWQEDLYYLKNWFNV